GFHFQIDQAVPREKREHVVEKRNLRLDRTVAAAVDEQLECDVGFGGLALDARAAAGHWSISFFACSRLNSAPAPRTITTIPTMASAPGTVMKNDGDCAEDCAGTMPGAGTETCFGAGLADGVGELDGVG